jgi:hypothetical protein
MNQEPDLKRAMKLCVLPSWILYKITPLPKDHPWHKSSFSLEMWALGATPLTFQLSALMWGVLTVLFIIALNLFKLWRTWKCVP